jgi:integrase
VQIIESWTSRYSNPDTRSAYTRYLTHMFRDTGTSHPRQVTESALIRWCRGSGLANNTVLQRVTVMRGFFRWCLKTGLVDQDPAADLRSNGSPLKQFTRLYGKRQSKNPGRWLTREEAFDVLVAHCVDGSDLGLRDEVILRLGLQGCRAREIGTMTLAALQLDASPARIEWIGKKSQPRQVIPGPRLVAALREYLTRYGTALGRPLSPQDRLICGQPKGTHGRPLVAWGQPLADPPQQIRKAVIRRAAAAGLGHVAPHDLRRTCAGILHTARDDSGAHHFDLLDIAHVLDHADGLITKQAYLDPMETQVKERASEFLD